MGKSGRKCLLSHTGGGLCDASPPSGLQPYVPHLVVPRLQGLLCTQGPHSTLQRETAGRVVHLMACSQSKHLFLQGNTQCSL